VRRASGTAKTIVIAATVQPERSAAVMDCPQTLLARR
jgi:hypothetical protein